MPELTTNIFPIHPAEQKPSVPPAVETAASGVTPVVASEDVHVWRGASQEEAVVLPFRPRPDDAANIHDEVVDVKIAELRGKIKACCSELLMLSARHPEMDLPNTLFELENYDDLTMNEVIVEARRRMTSETDEEPLAEAVNLLETIKESIENQIHLETNNIPEQLEKGDVFVNPKSRKRMVVEGIRKEDGGTIVMFSYEEKKDVRSEPGELLHQMPQGNFTVQRETGGYTKFHFGPRLDRTIQQFSEVATACQGLFEEVAAQNKDRLSETAFREVEKFQRRMKEVNRRVTNWNALSEEATWSGYEARQTLLGQLQKIVGKFPESLVTSNELLKQVWAQNQRKEKVEVDDHDRNGGDTKKKTKKRSARSRDESMVRAKAGPARGARDEAGLETAVSGEPATGAAVEARTGGRNPQRRQGRNEEILEFEAQGARELTDRETWQEFQKYRGARYSAERWWRDRRNSLERRIQEIRMQQQDITRMAKLIDKLYKRREWGQAMWRLGPRVQKIALNKTGDDVARDLDLMEQRKSRVLSKPIDFRKDDEELRFLYDYFFRYLAALQVGERVIASKLSKPKKRAPRVVEGAVLKPDTAPMETEAEDVAAEYAVATVAARHLGERWHEQDERVQIEVINGLRYLLAQKDMDVAEAQALLAQYNYLPQQQLMIIATQLSKGFNPAVARVLEKGDLPSTPEAIEGIATGLIEQQQLKRLPYDSTNS